MLKTFSSMHLKIISQCNGNYEAKTLKSYNRKSHIKRQYLLNIYWKFRLNIVKEKIFKVIKVHKNSIKVKINVPKYN